jgi:hypothetical protein
LVATALTGAVSWVFAPMLAEITTPGNAPRLLQLALFVIGLGVVGTVYLGCAWILRVPEIVLLLEQATALRLRLNNLVST